MDSRKKFWLKFLGEDPDRDPIFEGYDLRVQGLFGTQDFESHFLTFCGGIEAFFLEA